MQNNLQDELNRLQSWSIREKVQLIEALLSDVKELLLEPPEKPEREKASTALKIAIQQRRKVKPLYDFQEFRGIGHGIWDAAGGIDKFIEQERTSWDDEKDE